MCHTISVDPLGRAKHLFRFGICPPDECPTACALGKYPECPDPIGTGGDWFVAFCEEKSPQRKKVDAVPKGKKILICWFCLKANRRSVYAGHNKDQHLSLAKGIYNCPPNGNFICALSQKIHLCLFKVSYFLILHWFCCNMIVLRDQAHPCWRPS